MNDSEKINKESMITLKLIHVSPLIPMGIYIAIVIVMYTQVGAPMFESNFVITFVTGILGTAGIASLFFSYFLPRWIIVTFRKKSKTPPSLELIGVSRSACFIFASICGLTISILDTWIITMLLFIAILAAMFITFPTTDRLAKILE